MTNLELVPAPNPIFRMKAAPVTSFDDELKELADAMLEVVYRKRGLGIGANMVGVLKRVIAIDLQENGERMPLVCINPEIVSQSSETISREEASLCFPGIRVEIERPARVEITYQDVDGKRHKLAAEDWLATVIQHEMEYLDGRTFLDNVSKLKRDRLIKKMVKDMAHERKCNDRSCCP